MTTTRKVLVGYASAHGSTAEIAQFIGRILEEHHIEVTVASVTAISSVKDYDAVVLGSAVHAGMWLTPMSLFLDRFEDDIAGKPVFYFMTCIRVLEPDGREHALGNYVHHETLDKLAVREIAVFAGKLNWDNIDLKERWTLSLRYDGQATPGARSSDFRDWNAIRDWSVKVRDLIEKAAS